MALEDQPPGVLALIETARHSLDRKDLPAAIAVYEYLLEAESDNADVLAAVSGDLGSTGNVAPIIQIIAPLYDPERHGPAAGLNLLQAYLALGDPDGAQHMLDRLFALGLPGLEERLQGFANAISEMVETGAAAPVPGTSRRPEAVATGTAVSISKPIWFYGLEPLAAAILPAKGAGLRRVAFTQLALPGAYPDVREAMKKPEDEAGTLSRALPLWLAETFYFSTHYAPIAAIAVVTEADGAKHTALFGSEWTLENLRQLVNTTSDGLDYVFTGSLTSRDGIFQMTLKLWEVKRFRERKQFSVRWTPDTADAELVKFRDALCQFMEWRPAAGSAGLGPGRPGEPRAWLDLLGSSLGLFLAGKGLTPSSLLPPLPPIMTELRPAAAGDPVAALALLTALARARALGIDGGVDSSEALLADQAIVAEARDLLT